MLISTEPGKDREAYNELLKVPEVREIIPLFGEFDLIAKIEAGNIDELGRVVSEGIRSVRHVVNTRTLTGAKF